MSFPVPLDGRTITVDARWRLAIAVSPTDVTTGLPVGGDLQVGIEQASRRSGRIGRGFAPLRFDRPLPRNRSGTYTLVHRLRQPRPGLEPVQEVVLRIADPGRVTVPRRLRVPVWTLWRVAESEVAGPPVPASARSVAPALFPGPAFLPPGGCTGIRGRLLRYGEPLRWARITAVGRGGAVLGRAQGDERGEFLMLLTRSGTEPMAPPSLLTVRLEIAATPFAPLATGADPLADLVVEDAVRRGADAEPGEIDATVVRGERAPASYVLAPERPAVELRVGAIVVPPPLSVT